MRTLFTTLLISIFMFQTNFSQCVQGNNEPICKGVLAGLIFNLVYEDDTNPDNYEANEFPNPFVDLQENTELYKQLRILSYLTYGDGVGVFHYAFQPSYCFKIGAPMTKIETLIAVMEAWNIPPDYSGSIPFNDIDQGSYIFGYVNKAYDEGFIPNSSNYNPYEPFTQGETVILINDVLNSSYAPVNEDLYNLDNYFIPGIYSHDNLTTSRGMNQGVLNHYSKDSFVIPDVKMSLNFSHFYSTSMVEMPQSFYPVKPLGRGWSHTYNSYITKENNAIGNDDLYFITWSNGNIHIFNEDEGSNGEYISKGVYDEFDELGNGDIRITKKDQTRFYYEQIDNDLDIWYLTEIRDPNGNSIIIDYESAEADDYRRIEYVESPSGKQLTFEYLDGTDLIEKIEDPIGRDLFFEYNGVGGIWVYSYPVLAVFEDAKSQTTTYSYDISNQYNIYLLNRIQLPRGNLIEAEFDDDGKLSEYTINSNDPTEVDVDFDYEDEETTVEITNPVQGGGDFVEMYEFNMNGIVTDYSSPTDDLEVEYPTNGINVLLPDNSNLNGVDIEYDYDNNGNVTRIDKENGSIVEEFDYDSDNNLLEHTDPNGNITQYTYDSDENLIEILDAEGGSSTFNYDSFGQLLNQTNQEGITVNYNYENDGAVSSVLAPEGISSNYSYDGVNRLLTSNQNGLVSQYLYDPNDNVTSFLNSGGFLTSYDYDANDNLSNIRNANNVDTTFEYDDEDRVIEEQFGNLIKTYDYSDEGYLEQYTKPSGQQINYEYDDDGRIEETGTITDVDYNDRNLVESITNDTGTIAFNYDDLNRVETITTLHGYEVEYDFEDSGHLEEIIYPTINGIEFEVNYNYDDKNRVFIVTIEKNVGAQNVEIAEYEYLDDDRVEQIEYGNNTRTDYSYDNAGRFNYIEHFELGAPTSFYVEGSTLNNRGNITDVFQLVTPFPADAIEHGTSSENINYDYNQNNHINNANSTNYSVNDDGNTVSASDDFSSQYDIDDRLTNYNDVDNNTDYEYNPYNQRVESKIDGVTTKFIRDVLNDNILVELDQNNNPKYYYIYHPSGMLLARMKANGDLQYYYGDIRGSVVAMLDEDANITHQYSYEDFGWITKSSEPNNDFNRFRYVGAYGVEYDKQDLYYMRARYYKPSIGRFVTEDPIWSANLYPYADNNPISRIDPSGNIAIATTIQQGYSSLTNSLGNVLYKNGYGDAANELSNNSAVWDYAISNPIKAGIIIGIGGGLTAEVAVLAAGSAYALSTGAAATSNAIAGETISLLFYTHATLESGITTYDLLSDLSNGDSKGGTINYVKLVLPKFLEESLGKKGTQFIQALEFSSIYFQK